MKHKDLSELIAMTILGAIVLTGSPTVLHAQSAGDSTFAGAQKEEMVKAIPVAPDKKEIENPVTVSPPSQTQVVQVVISLATCLSCIWMVPSNKR
jgi:hypothetical protein